MRGQREGEERECSAREERAQGCKRVSGYWGVGEDDSGRCHKGSCDARLRGNGMSAQEGQ